MRFNITTAIVDLCDWGFGVDRMLADLGVYVVSLGPIHVTVTDTASEVA